ncbi:hypothetical protein MMP74_18405 [Acinetobacter sp. NIPH 1869]|uniref:hypothetical protein n=1 Tax=Acinetobacter higginsii TaxID=70347 RepID=UPI001F4B12CC|nr:hypothetical protein [Acinetobacter higginsii]MCH7306322.1 hypothetical protein [Acinetobacter higginsii]
MKPESLLITIAETVMLLGVKHETLCKGVIYENGFTAPKGMEGFCAEIVMKFSGELK